MTPRRVIGVVMIVGGAVLVARPELVRDALGRVPKTSSDWINLRATFGGMLVGLGAFLAWLPAVKPWWRTLAGLLLWIMAGVGLARAVGFVVDGDPDRRQFLWIIGEAVLVAGAAIVLRRRRAQ